MPGSEISAKKTKGKLGQLAHVRGVAGTLLVSNGHSQSEPKFY